MKKVLLGTLITAMLLVFSVANAAPRTIYRDASGRSTGSSQKVGNRTIYRDASGRSTGSSQEVGNRVIYRDAAGRNVGSGNTLGR